MSVHRFLGKAARQGHRALRRCVVHPFLTEARQDDRRATIEIEQNGETRTESIQAPMDCFSLEARVMSDLIETRELQPEPPLVGHEESVVIAGALESWRSALEQARKDRS